MNSWTARLGPAAVLVVVLLSAALTSSPERNGLCLTVLDVGQGDSLLVEFPDGDPWLIDGGGAPGTRFDVGLRRVLPALRERGIDRLGLVVMTHGDADHVGGLFAVLEQLAVDALLLPTHRGGGAQRSLVRLAGTQGVPVLVAAQGDRPPPPGGGVQVQLLHPTTADPGVSSNDGSVVLRIGLGDVWMLLTGDLEASGERRLALGGGPLAAQILKVGHHGSRTSSTREFLDAVEPLVAVTGAGAGNRFGFPHAAVSARLRKRGAPLLWTGRDGEVRTCTDGKSIQVDARPDARWMERQHVGAEAIQEWVSRSSPRAHRLTTWAASLPSLESAGASQDATTHRPRRSRGVRKARSRRGRPRVSKSKSKKSKKSAPPAPPRLIDDREWERSRRDRGKPKPPWRSRR